MSLLPNHTLSAVDAATGVARPRPTHGPTTGPIEADGYQVCVVFLSAYVAISYNAKPKASPLPLPISWVA